jgi:hypothetical protein
MSSCKDCDLLFKKYHLALINYLGQLQRTLTAAQINNMANFEKERIQEIQLQKRFIQSQDFWINHQKQHPPANAAKKMNFLKIEMS